ncbi:MAG: arylsulfatase [candidate division KSB1 bacterium]|nr:arylsulfatase [candidate division KSB1 bacterium]
MAELNRREFIKRAASAGAVFTFLQCRRQSRKPNFILILADDLGYGDLGCYGQEKIKTPVLDRMASQGVRFTQFYAGSTVCAPSRSALMTGQHTGHTRVRGNALVPLEPEDVTIAELLRRAGYATALIGKWGLGEEGSTGEPRKKGFDYFFGYLNQVHAHNYFPHYLWRNEEKIPLRNKVVFAQEGYAKGIGSAAVERVDYVPELMIEETEKYIEAHAGEPFFLFFSTTIPHANNEYYLSGAAHGMEIPDYGIYSVSDWPEPQKAHAAMISLLDQHVGRILQTLKDLGIEQDTFIFFSSDNGPHREGGFSPEFSNSSGGLRGIKRDLYEGGIRVPMIAYAPGRIAGGRTAEEPFAFWDFLPTLADLAGISAPPNIDGVSFAPILLGKEKAQRRHEFLYWEFHEGPASQQAVRWGKWKGIRHDPNGAMELYDLSIDSGETRNVAAEHPDVVEAIVNIMQRARTESREWPLRTAIKPG